MDRTAENSRYWMLRIVALLFSMADLAEKASARSWFVRRRVLRYLRSAESAAFRQVANAAREFGLPCPLGARVAATGWMADYDADDPEGAMRIAQRLRALAMALAQLLMLAESLPGSPAGRHAGRCATARHSTLGGAVLSPSLDPALRNHAIRAPPSAAAI